MDEEKFWFGFRQVNGHPFGNVVIEGPFASMEIAGKKMGRTTDWDMQYIGPFMASSRVEAQEKVEKIFSSL